MELEADARAEMLAELAMAPRALATRAKKKGVSLEATKLRGWTECQRVEVQRAEDGQAK